MMTVNACQLPTFIPKVSHRKILASLVRQERIMTDDALVRVVA